MGRLEIEGGGWASAIDMALSKNKNTIVMSVRTEFVEDVIGHWNLDKVEVVDLKDVRSWMLDAGY